MSHSINPVLLDAPATAATTPRNFARSSGPGNGPTFDQHLASTATQGAAITSPAFAPASASSDNSPAAADGTDSIKPASSWRVNRDAADVGHDIDDFTFDDFLDVINPLQHIPIVGTIYRELSGDTIKPVTRVAGDVLFGALTGSLLVSGILSVVGAAYEQQTGEEPVMQVADALFGIKSSNAAPDTMLASADKPVDPAAPSDEEKTIKLAEAAPVAPPVSPAPVQAVSLDQKETPGAASPAATPVTKQPYGGVLDMSLIAQNQQPAKKLASTAQTPGVRIGNTIYTSPLMSSAARIAATQAAKAPVQTAAKAPETSLSAQATVSANPPSSVAALTAAPSAALSIPGASPSDDKTLGQMMRNSADASAAGHALPPDLVRDMMLMALDKYKTAGNLAPGEMNIGLPN
jgi:hypothetical protein